MRLPRNREAGVTRIMGLDVGGKRVGIALSDSLHLCANPWGYIDSADSAGMLEKLRSLIDEYEVHHIVVGLPKNMNGTLGFQAAKAKEVADMLSLIPGITTSFYDERLSSREVENLLISAGVSRKKRKGVTDKLAATVILQNYLDSGKKESRASDGEVS